MGQVASGQRPTRLLVARPRRWPGERLEPQGIAGRKPRG